MVADFPLIPEGEAQEMRGLLAQIDDLLRRIEEMQDGWRKTILRAAMVEVKAHVVVNRDYNE
jgi:hypothetical protein